MGLAPEVGALAGPAQHCPGARVRRDAVVAAAVSELTQPSPPRRSRRTRSTHPPLATVPFVTGKVGYTNGTEPVEIGNDPDGVHPPAAHIHT